MPQAPVKRRRPLLLWVAVLGGFIAAWLLATLLDIVPVPSFMTSEASQFLKTLYPPTPEFSIQRGPTNESAIGSPPPPPQWAVQLNTTEEKEPALEEPSPPTLDLILDAVDTLFRGVGLPVCVTLTEAQQRRYATLEANTTDIRLLLNILVTPEHILVDTGESNKSILRRQYASLYSMLRMMPELVRFVGPKNIHIAVTQSGFDDSKVGAAMTLLAKELDTLEISYDIASHGPSETLRRAQSKNKKWTSVASTQRVPALVGLRNHLIEQLGALHRANFNTVLFVDTPGVWCLSDVLELVLEHKKQDAIVSCAVGWDNGRMLEEWNVRSLSGYAPYTSEQMSGKPNGGVVPFTQPGDEETRRRVEADLPAQVFSCWSSLVVATSSHFSWPSKPEHRFRFAHPVKRTGTKHWGKLITSIVSERFLLAVDFWTYKHGRFMLVPRAQWVAHCVVTPRIGAYGCIYSVAYSADEYHKVPKSISTIQEEGVRIEWLSTPPAKIVYHDDGDWRTEVCTYAPPV
jgi:Cryptococcal mannosyltransferase 1